MMFTFASDSYLRLLRGVGLVVRCRLGRRIFRELLFACFELLAEFHQALFTQKLFRIRDHLALFFLDVMLKVLFENLDFHVPSLVGRSDLRGLSEQTFYLLVLFVTLAHFELSLVRLRSDQNYGPAPEEKLQRSCHGKAVAAEN